MMQFTLITAKGTVCQFYMESLARTYQQVYGGVVIAKEILDQEVVDKAAV